MADPAVPVEQLRAAIRLLWPEQITPIGKRMLESICEQAERVRLRHGPGGGDTPSPRGCRRAAQTTAGLLLVLHSAACLRVQPDLRECPYSLALDCGIDSEDWPEDVPVAIGLDGQNDGETWLFPVWPTTLASADEADQ